MNIKQAILIALAVISVGTNIWFLWDRAESQISSAQSVSELANGVSSGLRESLNVLRQNQIDWSLVYAGVSSAAANANAARLMATQVHGVPQDLAFKLSDFEGELIFYESSLLAKAQGTASYLDETDAEKFAQVLMTKLVPVNMPNTYDNAGDYMRWIDSFEHSLAASNPATGRTDGGQVCARQITGFPLFVPAIISEDILSS